MTKAGLRAWFAPPRPGTVEHITEPAQRRAVVIELLIVFTITLGLSGLRSLVSLLDAALRPESLRDQSVALNSSQADVGLLDLISQLLGVLQLVAWGALGLYLLYRAGMRLTAIGLDRRGPGRDALGGIGLTALIGVPGLALYFVSYQLGFNLAVQPSTLTDTWWRPVTLTLSAFGNAFAEEVLVVGYLLTRLRQLGTHENGAVVLAAVLRGSYHLYQGLGGFVGNIVMGLVFGRIWQRTNRLVPLIVAHTLLDFVAFVGYALLRDKIGWLP